MCALTRGGVKHFEKNGLLTNKVEALAFVWNIVLVLMLPCAPSFRPPQCYELRDYPVGKIKVAWVAVLEQGKFLAVLSWTLDGLSS